MWFQKSRKITAYPLLESKINFSVKILTLILHPSRSFDRLIYLSSHWLVIQTLAAGLCESTEAGGDSVFRSPLTVPSWHRSGLTVVPLSRLMSQHSRPISWQQTERLRVPSNLSDLAVEINDNLYRAGVVCSQAGKDRGGLKSEGKCVFVCVCVPLGCTLF